MAIAAHRRSAESRRDPRPIPPLIALQRRCGPSTSLRARPELAEGTGFTLVEVLVALAILAVALAAGFRSVAQTADSATVLKTRTLALWVAENRLAAAQLEIPAPASGERTGSEDQAGATFTWHESVSGTPNPAFRRIEITVAESARADYVLARLVGYLGASAQP